MLLLIRCNQSAKSWAESGVLTSPWQQIKDQCCFACELCIQTCFTHLVRYSIFTKLWYQIVWNLKFTFDLHEQQRKYMFSMFWLPGQTYKHMIPLTGQFHFYKVMIPKSVCYNSWQTLMPPHKNIMILQRLKRLQRLQCWVYRNHFSSESACLC